MRADAIGLFWQDLPKPKAEKVKREPPEPVWLCPDYLPGLDEALRFPIELMSDAEIVAAATNGDRFFFDVEVFPNYFVASFRSHLTGKGACFELYDGNPLDVDRLGWILSNVLTVGFNSLAFDLTIAALALAGKTCSQLKQATNQLIIAEERPAEVLRRFKVKPLKINHIDLIEVAPLTGNLKIYGGRLHTQRMQDLPFHPDTVLSPEQRAIVRWYNIHSDLSATRALYDCLTPHLDLRVAMSTEIGIDLRSKSDAQIAESVIGHEIAKYLGRRPERPKIAIGTTYRYQVPPFIRYQSELLNYVLTTVATASFVVGESGAIQMPEQIECLNIEINGSRYQLGIGGLHSCESTIAHKSNDEFQLIDRDVTSYYPMIILNLGLFPRHLGEAFQRVYRDIVDRRIVAKKNGDKVKADSLKITVNGGFGKLASKYSILYSPDLLIQVTLTGQLALLMLIERLELASVHVVSANTDGIVIKVPRNRKDEVNAIIKGWERDTGFETEDTEYAALYCRDVNNYIAVKVDGSTKNKGAYANPWASKKNPAERLHKNPTNIICIEAAQLMLTKGIPVENTISECRDITKFVTVRNVTGGAVKIWPDRTQYLGKSIRWYYAKGVGGEIVYAKNGNKVPNSEGAMPLMDLPSEFPVDVDVDWYVNESKKILAEIGFL